MAIKFRCLQCQKGLTIGSRMAGTKIQCVQCQAELTVPATSDQSLTPFHVRQGADDSLEGARLLEINSDQVEALEGPPVAASIPVNSEVTMAPAARTRLGWLAAAVILLMLSAGGVCLYVLMSAQTENQAAGEDDPERLARNSGGDPRLLNFVDNDKGIIVPFPEDGGKKKPDPPIKAAPSPPPNPLPTSILMPELLAPTPQETEEELYRKALQMGLAALDGENFQRAKEWYKIAGGLRMTDEVLKGLERAEGGLLGEQDRERRRQQLSADMLRRGEFELWMRRGQTNLGWGELAKALDAFQKAGALFPGDPNVSQYVTKTQEAMAAAALAEKSQRQMAEREKERRHEKKRKQDQDDYTQAMVRGSVLYRQGKYREALAPFYLAKELQMDNGEARTEWLNAQKMLELKEIDDLRKEEERWRLAREERDRKRAKELIIDFDLFLNDANKLERDGQFDRALIALSQALHINPTHPEALRMRRRLEKSRDDEATYQQAALAKQVQEAARLEAETRKRAEDFERQANAYRLEELAQQREIQFEQMIARGQWALGQRRFDVALRLFTDARLLRPGDPMVLGFIQKTEQGQAQFNAGLAWMQKQKEAIDREKDETVRQQLLRQRQEREEKEAKEQKLFQAQLQERLRKEGEEALKKQRYDIALARLETVKVLNPEDKFLVGLDRRAREDFKAWKQQQALDREKDEKAQAAAWAEANRRREESARAQAEQKARFDSERQARDLRDTIDAGLAAQRRGQYDKALSFFNQAKNLGGNDDDLKNLIDRASREKETYGEVMANLAKKQAEQEKLLTALRQRDLEEARRRELERTARDRLGKLLAEGTKALGQRQFEEAMAAFSQALEIERSHQGARDGLRQAQEGLEQRLASLRQDQERRAKEGKQKKATDLARLQDEDYRHAMAFGRDAFDKKRYDAAVACFDQALASKPGDGPATNERNRALAARDALALQGKQDLERVQKKQADEAALQKALALAAEEANRKRRTLEQELAELAQLKAVARAALELGQLDAARAALQAAEKRAPNDPVLTQLRGLLAKAGQKADQTAQANQDDVQLQQALAAIPHSPGEKQQVVKAKADLHVKQGDALLERQRFEEASAEFQAALRLANDNPRAQAGLERARKRTP